MPPHPAIARDRVRHVGDTVAIVVGESLAAARDAAELIAIDYEPLPAVVETVRAHDPGQPLVWDEAPGNLCFDWEVGDGPAVERAMAGARHRVALELINNRVVVNSMEPRGAVGEYYRGEDTYTLWSSTQGSHFVRNLLAESIFKIPENRIRVVTRDVGGGFGMKLFLYPEHILVLWAAKKLDRPVKWTPDRSDAFMTDTQGRDNITRLELALDDELRFLALDVEILANMGAYLSNFAPEIPTVSGAVMHSGVYAIPAIHVGVKGVFTNTVPVDAYRGAGRPEAAYAVERLDRLCRASVRGDGQKNCGGAISSSPRRCRTRPRSASTTTAANSPATWIRRSPRPTSRAFRTPCGGAGTRPLPGARPRRLYRAVGLPARRVRRVALRPERHLDDPDGDAVVGAGASDRLYPARRRAARHRTGKSPRAAGRYCGDFGLAAGTGGSRSLPVGGASLAHAADKLIAKGRRIAAHLFEAAEADVEFADGVFTVSGTDRRLGIEEVARAAFNPMQQAPGVEPGFAEIGHFTPPQPTFPNGCHVCEVEIEPETGHIEIVRYLVVDDFGTVINPLLAQGAGAGRGRARGRPGDARTHSVRPGDGAAADRLVYRLLSAARR